MAEITRWVWEIGTRRYRNLDTGRFVGSAQVVNLVNGIVDRTDSPVSALNTMLGDKRLNAADWKTGFARQIKNAYIQQAELAAGGRAQMTPQLWGMVGGTVREQYGYLNDFAKLVANGQLTATQIEARTKMYINSSREAFWRVKDAKAREQGLTEERWIPIGDDATCSPCSDAGAMGWQPIGTFAQPGSGRVRNSPRTYCEGLTNCRCEKEYRKRGREEPLKGYEGNATFSDIGSATGRAREGQVLINRQDWEQMSALSKRGVVAHETIHNTVEEYVLHDNAEWDIAKETLTVGYFPEKEGVWWSGEPQFFGGHMQIGESIADAIPSAMYEDWPDVINQQKRDEIAEWARDVTRRAGYDWELLKKDIARMVKELNAQS